jgi:hypothetical protein
MFFELTVLISFGALPFNHFGLFFPGVFARFSGKEAGIKPLSSTSPDGIIETSQKDLPKPAAANPWDFVDWK